MDVLRAFGCRADRGKEVIYLGVRDGPSMGSVVLDPTTRKLGIADNLIFMEDEFPSNLCHRTRSSNAT